MYVEVKVSPEINSLNPVIVNFYWTFINRKDKINEKKAENDPLKKQ